MAAPEIDRVGSVLSDKWRIERKLGEGGMGAVYAAIHVRNAKRVAVKLLHEGAQDPEALARFQREGYAANIVDDPGVVAVYDDGLTEDGAAYLVMDLLDGESFEQRAERNGGRLGVLEVLSLMHPVLVVLGKAHGLGVIHRDLKPSNLFLTSSSQVKVLDFGLATVKSAPHLRITGPTTPTMGTLGFMPAEQARGDWEQVGPPSDVWALGATMFALLSGLCPHEHGDMTQFLRRVLCDPAQPLAAAVGGVPRVVGAIVDRALAFHAADRFSDATEMRIALEEAYARIAAIQNEVTSEMVPPFLGDVTLSMLASAPSIPLPTAAISHSTRELDRVAAQSPGSPRAGLSLMATSVSGEASGGRSETMPNGPAKKLHFRRVVAGAAGVAGLAVAALVIVLLQRPRTSTNEAPHVTARSSQVTNSPPIPAETSETVDRGLAVTDLPAVSASAIASAVRSVSESAKGRAPSVTVTPLSPAPTSTSNGSAQTPVAPPATAPVAAPSTPSKPDLDRRH